MATDLAQSRDRLVVNLTVGLAVGCCVAAMVYSGTRVIQSLFYPSPDPRAVLVVSRIAFFWRAWIAGFVGVLATIGASGLRARSPERFDRMLPIVVGSALVLTAAQGIFVP